MPLGPNVPEFPRTSGVYMILNGVTGGIYVGSAVDLRKRQWQHLSMLRLGKHNNKRLQRSFQKHGADNFAFSVLEGCSKEDTLAVEQKWLDATRRWRVFNICEIAGSNLGKQFTAEHRRKISESNKGKTRRGTPWTAERREKMRGVLANYHPTAETKAKIGLAHRGRKLSPEVRTRMSAAQMGRVHSLETRAKLSAIFSTRRLQIVSPLGEHYDVMGIVPFCREHGLSSKCVRRLFSGEQHQHKGWVLEVSSSP